MYLNKKIFIYLSVFLSLILFSGFSETKGFDFNVCDSIKEIDRKCQTLSEAECRKILEKCNEYFEEKSAEIGRDISRTETEKANLKDQITNLQRQIQNLDYQIYQGNLAIKDKSLQIDDTQLSINRISLKIEESKNQLSNTLRIIYKEDQRSLAEVGLAGDFSDFFNNLTNLETLNSRLQEILRNTKSLRDYLEEKEEQIFIEKEGLERATAIQQMQRRENDQIRSEREGFLEMTEAQYQTYLREKEEVEKKAAEVRERLFSLVGIPEMEAPTFGEAIKIANEVSSRVGIRPAFLLGIISAESALGRNVGQCYVTDSQTGAGRFQNGSLLSRLMHPTRDLPIFLRLTGEKYSEFPVSCWIRICANTSYHHLVYNNITITSDGSIMCPAGYVPFGWGGAMGPAQFIPSTWALYEPRIKSVFGISNPNPWNVKHAFSASALYLSELGANQRTLFAERNAAHRYSGGYAWYSDQVMQRAACIQSFIDTGSMSSGCERLILP